MDDIIWFPITDHEKARFEQICSLNGVTPKEWFIKALLESEHRVLPFQPQERRKEREEASLIQIKDRNGACG